MSTNLARDNMLKVEATNSAYSPLSFKFQPRLNALPCRWNCISVSLKFIYVSLQTLLKSSENVVVSMVFEVLNIYVT